MQHHTLTVAVLGYREQACRLCEINDYDGWEQWMPSILQSETLLYAQAFAAVNHIKFINPKAYKAESYVLKGHAIHKIKEKIDEESNDPDEAASDANISAILCMASAAQIEVRFPVHFNTQNKDAQLGSDC